MPFVFSNLHMNNLSNDIVPLSNSFADVLLSFTALNNAKIWAQWIRLKFWKQIWMNIMSFYEFRYEQTGSGSRSYIFKKNKIIALTKLLQQ